MEVNKPCGHCGKPEGKQRCSRCKVVYYCGRECQNTDWKEHKKTCGAAPARPGQAPRQVPSQFICPITHEIMTDPVTTADGHAYERAAIEQWLRDNETSPLTGQTLQNKVVIPCVALRSAIRRELALAAAASLERLSPP